MQTFEKLVMESFVFLRFIHTASKHVLCCLKISVRRRRRMCINLKFI